MGRQPSEAVKMEGEKVDTRRVYQENKSSSHPPLQRAVSPHSSHQNVTGRQQYQYLLLWLFHYSTFGQRTSQRFCSHRS